MRHFCPCCGHHGLSVPAYANLSGDRLVRGVSPPYSIHYGMPSYSVCTCCGFEFGNDDEPGTSAPASFESFMVEWIAEGCHWFDESKRPEHWNLSDQLQAASLSDAI